MAGSNGSNGNGAKVGTDKVKQGLAQMLKGGVIVSFNSLMCRCIIRLWMYARLLGFVGRGLEIAIDTLLCAYDMFNY